MIGRAKVRETTKERPDFPEYDISLNEVINKYKVTEDELKGNKSLRWRKVHGHLLFFQESQIKELFKKRRKKKEEKPSGSVDANNGSGTLNA
jgi:hypothetical protein